MPDLYRIITRLHEGAFSPDGGRSLDSSCMGKLVLGMLTLIGELENDIGVSEQDGINQS